MSENPLFSLFTLFATLSLLSIGGANATIPEMHRVAVDVMHWMSDRQFADMFAISQLSPGPNVIIVALIGFHVAGAAGAVVAISAMCVPTCVLAYLVARTWDRFKDDLDLFQAVANEVAMALENAQLYQRTKELSARDDLTGLFNRRHFFEILEKEAQRARRYRRVFSLLMLDLDQFKHYNDTHGHLKGDEVLKEVARLLHATVRGADVVTRFGGEEFGMVFPEITKQGAMLAAEKIRAAMEQYPFFGREQQPGGRMTATIGVATYPEDSEDGLELVDLADRAMYLGKQQGGNRVAVLPPPNGTSSDPQELAPRGPGFSLLHSANRKTVMTNGRSPADRIQIL